MNRNAVCLFSFCILPLLTAGQTVSVEDVVALALQKNYDVRLSQNTAAVAGNNNRYAFGVFLPNINATGAYSRNNVDSRNVTFGDVETLRTGAQSTNVNGSAQLVWTLFDGTQMFATRKRLSAQEALSNLNVRDQMMNTAANVITTYFSVVRQVQQRKAIQEQMSVSEERVKLAERKLQVGTGGKPELLQAKVDLNAFRTAAIQQETLIRQLKDQLNLLVGLGLPDTFEIYDTIPINLQLSLDEIRQNVETNNATLVAAKKNIRVSELTLRESRASRSPIINFTSSYNFNRQENELVTSPIAQKYIRNRGYNYGLSVSIPIMNGMNTNRLIGQSKVNIERQKLIYDQQTTIVMIGIRIAYTNYENAKRTLLIEEENILLAKENVSIALEGFRRGITTFIELRTAQQSLADAYNRLIAARFNAKISETELFRLQGSLLN
ncbi:MAG: TolC family protein [Cytophagales bacterium]|nr:TolC family protein [Cytophagales bacterium]